MRKLWDKLTSEDFAGLIQTGLFKIKALVTGGFLYLLEVSIILQDPKAVCRTGQKGGASGSCLTPNLSLMFHLFAWANADCKIYHMLNEQTPCCIKKTLLLPFKNVQLCGTEARKLLQLFHLRISESFTKNRIIITFKSCSLKENNVCFRTKI